MLHLRVISPSSLTERTLDLLRDDEAVTHLFVLTGAAQRPVGDVISCDIAREGAEDILERLRDLGLEEQGGISVEQVDPDPVHVGRPGRSGRRPATRRTRSSGPTSSSAPATRAGRAGRTWCS